MSSANNSRKLSVTRKKKNTCQFSGKNICYGTRPRAIFSTGVVGVLGSIVFRYFANDYSRERYKFAIGHRRFRFPIFREAMARNSPTKWNVLCLTAGQLTNARRQGLPKTPFALQKLCLASRCYLFRGNLNCTYETSLYFCLTRYRKKLLEAIVP